jgi:hypothetical protein
MRNTTRNNARKLKTVEAIKTRTMLGVVSIGDVRWFRSAIPPQPRHPHLSALLESQAAFSRVQVSRRARRFLIEHNIPFRPL